MIAGPGECCHLQIYRPSRVPAVIAGAPETLRDHRCGMTISMAGATPPRPSPKAGDNVKGALFMLAGMFVFSAVDAQANI